MTKVLCLTGGEWFDLGREPEPPHFGVCHDALCQWAAQTRVFGFSGGRIRMGNEYLEEKVQIARECLAMWNRAAW